jgi:hypothetical protein
LFFSLKIAYCVCVFRLFFKRNRTERCARYPNRIRLYGPTHMRTHAHAETCAHTRASPPTCVPRVTLGPQASHAASELAPERNEALADAQPMDATNESLQLPPPLHPAAPGPPQHRLNPKPNIVRLIATAVSGPEGAETSSPDTHTHILSPSSPFFAPDSSRVTPTSFKT